MYLHNNSEAILKNVNFISKIIIREFLKLIF